MTDKATNIPAIAGLDSTSRARVVLYQSGRFVHAPLEGLQLQPLNDTLSAIAALTGEPDKGIYFTGEDTAALFTLTAFARTLLDDADASAALTTLGVSAFIKTLLDDADATAARQTLGANDASNLTTGTLPNARVSSTLTPDKAYRQGNILGTVSQSGGVPTGALVEVGSNANGDYVRWADGTQICTQTYSDTASFSATGALQQDGNFYSWIYPASFSSVPVVGASISNGSYIWPVTYSTSSSGTSVSVLATAGTGATLNLKVLAMGRWY